MAKTALITGASGGIGRAICKSLVGGDFRLGMVGRDEEKLERVRRELEIGKESALMLPCDVTDREKVKSMVEAALAQLGAIDVLVCAAGINIAQRGLRSTQPADWDRVINVNLHGSFNVIYYVLEAMRARGEGLIIQISSMAGRRANFLAGTAYSASKFAQAALGICIGREERGRGIRSSVIYPGEVNTGMLDQLLDQRANRPGASDGGRKEMILQPEDVAAAVRFIVDLPARAHVPELVMKPTIDDFT
jgi:NADP-dependent 3-hydroxy acid dehydrogenase YdfG